jgi:hypothetical protein
MDADQCTFKAPTHHLPKFFQTYSSATYKHVCLSTNDELGYCRACTRLSVPEHLCNEINALSVLQEDFCLRTQLEMTPTYCSECPVRIYNSTCAAFHKKRKTCDKISVCSNCNRIFSLKGILLSSALKHIYSVTFKTGKYQARLVQNGGTSTLEKPTMHQSCTEFW